MTEAFSKPKRFPNDYGGLFSLLKSLSLNLSFSHFVAIDLEDVEVVVVV